MGKSKLCWALTQVSPNAVAGYDDCALGVPGRFCGSSCQHRHGVLLLEFEEGAGLVERQCKPQ